MNEAKRLRKQKWSREYYRRIKAGEHVVAVRGGATENDRRRVGPPIEAFHEEPRVPDVGEIWDFRPHNLRMR